MLLIFKATAILGTLGYVFARTPTPSENIKKKTYYIDPTCHQHVDFRGGFEEAFKNAKEVVHRTNSEKDNDFGDIFQHIFKVHPLNAADAEAVDKIMKPFEEMSVMTQSKPNDLANELKTADVRIFCDDDIVWDENDPKTKDARWEPHGDGFIDTVNMVYGETPGCCKQLYNGRKAEGCAMSTKFTFAGGDHNGHNPDRSVISICDYIWLPPDDVTKTPLIVTDELSKRDFAAEEFTIQGMIHLICRIMLHEFIHALNPEVEDLPDLEHAYGWKNVLDNPEGIAHENADNYAYLSMWAMVAKWGWTLPRALPPPDITDKCEKEKYLKQSKADIQAGKLVKLTDMSQPDKRTVFRRYSKEKAQSRRIRRFLEEDIRFRSLMDSENLNSMIMRV